MLRRNISGQDVPALATGETFDLLPRPGYFCYEIRETI